MGAFFVCVCREARKRIRWHIFLAIQVAPFRDCFCFLFFCVKAESEAGARTACGLSEAVCST